MNKHGTTLEFIQHVLDEMQAKDIVVLDVHEQTTITDYMIICSGRSSRQVKAIANELMEKMKSERAIPALHHTGIDTGEWALIDFGDWIVHIMQPSTRDFFDLESLWSKNIDA